MTIHLTVKTNQEAYDVVKAHLSGMPKRAVNAEGDCLYCTDDGLRCAVGALLDCSDDEARALPDHVAHGLVAEGLVDVADVDLDFLDALQLAHDDRGNWTDDGFVGDDELRYIAERWGLTP